MSTHTQGTKQGTDTDNNTNKMCRGQSHHKVMQAYKKMPHTKLPSAMCTTKPWHFWYHETKCKQGSSSTASEQRSAGQTRPIVTKHNYSSNSNSSKDNKAGSGFKVSVKLNHKSRIALLEVLQRGEACWSVFTIRGKQEFCSLPQIEFFSFLFDGMMHYLRRLMIKADKRTL